MSGSGPHEVPICRERPEREVRAVAVILQIKHAGETGRREVRIRPEAVGALRAQQILNATSRRNRTSLSCSHQPQQCPSGLVRGAGGAFAQVSFAGVGVVALAPAAIAVLTASSASQRRGGLPRHPGRCRPHRGLPTRTTCRRCGWCPSARTRSLPRSDHGAGRRLPVAGLPCPAAVRQSPWPPRRAPSHRPSADPTRRRDRRRESG